MTDAREGSGLSDYAPCELLNWDAVSLSAAIHSRDISCREVMNSYLDHIARCNPLVNAIVSVRDRDALLAEADERDAQLDRKESMGWLHGIPQAIKDLALTAGLRTTLGSPLFSDLVPATDGIVVSRMKRDGAIIIGKTNVPEFGLGSHSYNPLFGVTGSAYDPSRSAGGSSGGAAAALAMRMLPVADGSDMMGSLRNPAAYNHVFGLRPSFGRVPYGPTDEVFGGQLATEGPMARTVTDLAHLLATQAGADDRVPLSNNESPAQFKGSLDTDVRGWRIAWAGDWSGHLAMDEGVLPVCERALDTLKDVGCEIDAKVPRFDPHRLWQSWLHLRQWSVSGRLAPLYNDEVKRQQLKPEARWEIEQGFLLSGVDLYKAQVARSAWYETLRQFFKRYDFLALPSAQVFPFPIEQHWPKTVGGRSMDTYHRWMEVVVPASLAGCPVISVPAGFNEQGLPMGLQLIGRHQADLHVLQLARAYEQGSGELLRQLPPSLAHVSSWA